MTGRRMGGRALAAMLGALLLSGALAACGGDDGAAEGAAVTEASTTAFPVTIEHKYGETTIDAAPERVVSVGFTDQDFLLALGVTPVGIRDWYGDQPDATWPWAQDELGGAEPEVLPADEINFEAVAALQPDLIVGVSSGMTEAEYETLAAIAPTITQSDDFVDYGMPWQDMTLMIGDAVGQADQAQALVEETEARFAEAREAHPEWDGQTGVMSFVMAADEVGGYAPEDTRSQVLTNLGFVINPDIVERAEEAGAFYASFSVENIALLDSDVVVWVSSTDDIAAQIKASPLRDALVAAQEGREVFMATDVAAAAGFSSPLSLPYVLEQLLPQLEAATDGDPATVPE